MCTTDRENRRYSPEELAAVGLMEFAGGTHSGTRGVKVTEPKNSSHETGKSLVSVGPGLPAITRRV